MMQIALSANGTLLHRQLYSLLKQQILNGMLRPGDQLPTQDALCTQYSVSRITVRRALSDLQAEGLIRVGRGVGAFVESQNLPSQDHATLNFVAGLKRVVEETTVHVVSYTIERCPPRVAHMLRLEDDEDEALRIVRIRKKRRVPVIVTESWSPKALSERITRQAVAREPLFDLVTREGADLGAVVQEFNAELADPVTAGLLQVEPNSPILRMERLLHDRHDQPLQFLTVRSSPLRSRLIMQIKASELNTLGTGHLVHDVSGKKA